MDWWKGLLLFDYPGRRETTQRVDTFYETLHERANQLTPWEQKNRTETPLEPVGLPLGIKLLGYERVAQVNWQMKTSCQATLAVLAIKLYEKTYDGLPDDLVTRGSLETLPRDYYSDGPLGYRQTADGFILYSRGEDLKDDGGTPATNENGELRRYGSYGDWVFWPVSPKNQK